MRSYMGVSGVMDMLIDYDVVRKNMGRNLPVAPQRV